MIIVSFAAGINLAVMGNNDWVRTVLLLELLAPLVVSLEGRAGKGAKE